MEAMEERDPMLKEINDTHIDGGLLRTASNGSTESGNSDLLESASQNLPSIQQTSKLSSPGSSSADKYQSTRVEVEVEMLKASLTKLLEELGPLRANVEEQFKDIVQRLERLEGGVGMNMMPSNESTNE
tara:strand:- start:305 stop:691 length:387 start_codon:yes stop_codon:yes gene_type:complete